MNAVGKEVEVLERQRFEAQVKKDYAFLEKAFADAMQLVRYATDEMQQGQSVDIFAVGPSSALVALHAAGCTGPLVRQVRLRTMPISWQESLARPIAHDVYSDVLPGVLQRYDVPDLVRALGQRLVMER